MSVSIALEELDGGLRKIALDGTLDAPGTIDIENEFQSMLLNQGGNVIVDLGELVYMSSYGLRMLLLGAKSLKDAGGEMHLAAANERVMELISLAGYDTMFPVHPSVEDAIRFLTG